VFDAEYAASLAKRLAAAPRFAGTSGERKARDLLLNELSQAGLEAIAEPFRVRTFKVNACRLESIDPPFQVPCSPLGFSGETGPEGVTGDVIYIESVDKALTPSREGWIGLASRRPGKDEWRRIVGKASGLIIAEDNRYRLPSHVAVPYEWREKYGSLPSMYVSYGDAIRLLSSKKARIVLEQKYLRPLSYNVVAEKRGTKYPDEIILVTAHYDSVYGVRGAVDNAGGTAFAVALARAFAQRDSKRTLRVALFSGEELGLRGSQAYVKRHREELDKIKLVLNLDVHGDAIGRNGAVVTGPKELKDYAESRAKILGYTISFREDVMSSDGTSFAREGVPVLNLYRAGGTNIDMHTVRDRGDHISPLAYRILGAYAETLLDELLNAETIPFPHSIPEELSKKVKEYFSRWEV